MRAAAVILAAGASRRFGSPKQGATLGGRRMVEIIAETAREAGLSPVIAVVPSGLELAASVVPAVNDEPDAGVSRSLKLGVAAVPPDAEGVVILLGDEPLVAPRTLRAILRAGRDDGVRAVATRVGERIGPPVLLRRHAFDLVDRATGDDGLGPLLRDAPGLVLVDLPEPSFDVDTRADFDALVASWPNRPER